MRQKGTSTNHIQNNFYRLSPGTIKKFSGYFNVRVLGEIKSKIKES